MSDTTPSNRVRDILNTAAADLTPDVVYAAIQVAERRRDRADDDIRLLNAKFVEVSRAVHVDIVDSNAHKDETKSAVFGQGFRDAQEGHSQETNPYIPEDFQNHGDWNRGWLNLCRDV